MDAHPVANAGTVSSHAFNDLTLPAALQASLADEFKARQAADIEQECRQFILQTALICIELGKRLCFLKSLVQHGDWITTLERIGIDPRAAQRMMRAAICFLSNAGGLRIVEAAKSKTKLLELLVLDDEEVEVMAHGGEVRGITIAALPSMTVAKLRETLKANNPEGEISPKTAKTLKCLDVETFGQAAISLVNERFDQAAAPAMTQPDGKCLVDEAFERQGKFSDVGESGAAAAAPAMTQPDGKCLVNEAFEHQGKFSDVGESGAAAAASKVIYLDENHDPAYNLPLQPGDRIRSLHAQRPGSVVRVYHDGSACILWDDGEPQAEGLGHERMPRELLELVKRPDPGAARARRKDYCRELCRVIARYADDAEVTELSRALEGVSANILARRYCPGLNAAAYDVFARLGMKGGVQ